LLLVLMIVIVMMMLPRHRQLSNIMRAIAARSHVLEPFIACFTIWSNSRT
jgi:hypothetical protein